MHRRVRASGLCLLAGLLLSASAEAAFQLRKRLTVQGSQVAGAAPHVDFPVLLDIQNDPDLRTTANGGDVQHPLGYDIVFRDCDNLTPLDFEVERYDPVTGSLRAWVRVPSLEPGVDTPFYLYYSDSTITTPQETPGAAWGAPFAGVYHLEETPTGAAGDAPDSSGTGNHGRSRNVEPGDSQPARIGNGYQLDGGGSNEFVEIPDSTSLDITSNFTLSGWVRTDSVAAGGFRGIVNKAVGGANAYGLFVDDPTTGRPAVRINGTHLSATAAPAWTTGSWYHYAAVLDDAGNQVRFYVDGALLGAPIATALAPAAGTQNVGIGQEGGDDFWNGALDEIRIQSTARSAGWIQTEVANQSTPSSFVSVSVEENVPGGFVNATAGSGLAFGGNKDGGLAWGDFNEDGCLDLLVNSDDNAFDSALFVQDNASLACDGTFTDVTACLASGLAGGRGERSAVWGDLDNDGDLDFVRNGIPAGDVEYYFNNGPGAACAGWSAFGVGGAPSGTLAAGSSEGIGILDFDLDGDLDLLVDDNGASHMFVNDGAGNFTDDLTTGLPTGGGFSDYIAVADIDDDGDIDVLDRRAAVSDLFLNDGTGSYAATAFDQTADNNNKGGSAFCDFDDDGDLDLFWTDNGTNQIWEQSGVGSGSFVARAVPAGLPAVGIDGVACGDVDNDGDLDLALTNSGNDFLFRNDGGFTFTNVTPASFGATDGEALAFGDYDRDGDLDLVINQDTANELWQNQTDNDDYLMVRALQDLGGGVERDAIGATVTLRSCTGGVVSGLREVNGGRGHGSQDPALVHMGLPCCGATSGPDATYVVRVSFLDGSVVGKAVTPSALAGYNLVTVRSTDADDLAACATAVDLVSFEARVLDGAVALAWETGAEIDNLGFHVYRALEEDGPYERVTSSLVPGMGSSPEGARYELRDEGLVNGVTYFYKLVDVETTGRTKEHGPVSAVPSVGESTASHSPPVRATFGDPSSNSVDVVRRGPRGVVLELTTGGFHVYPDAEGTVTFEIPGFELEGALPGVRVWVEGEGSEARVQWARGRDVLRFETLAPGAPSSAVMEPSGVVRVARGRLSSATDRARVVRVMSENGSHRALLELSPLQWDGKHLLLARKLRVRVAFRDPPRTRRERLVRPRRRSVAAYLATTEPGLYEVRFEDVFARGRAYDASTLRLSRQGETAAFHVEPDDGRFRPGSRLFFVSEGGKANPYGNEAVYALEMGGEALRMKFEETRPSGPIATTYGHRIDLERDLLYQATLVDATDRWLWTSMLAPGTTRVDVALTGLAPSHVPARLRVDLLGGSDTPAFPDHHVRVLLNDTFVGETSWNAKKPAVVDVDVPAGVLREGLNVLAVENAGDTEAPYSIVYLDRVSLEYPREAVAESGRFEGTALDSGSLRIRHLGAAAHAVDVTDARPSWLLHERSEQELTIRVEAGRRYLAVSADAVRRPEVRWPAPSRLLTDTRQADYLVVGPAALLAEAEPLIALRRSQGLSVRAVSLEEVVSELGQGEKTPRAVRALVEHAYARWKRPRLRYLLLLGDASYDFDDVYGLGGEEHRLPPWMLRTDFLWTASDPAYGDVEGDDLVPELAVGRLPAANPEELRALVRKILDHESARPRLDGRFVLVADDADRAGRFEADAERLAGTVLAGRDIEKIYLSKLGAGRAREAVMEAFDGGASLVSYLGHGGIHLWASENVFDNDAVDALAPQSRQPILLTMNCLNGYFHFPFFDALAERLVEAEGRGAIAAFAPSGLSLHDPAARLHEALVRALLDPRHRRLGDAVLAAQRSYAESGGTTELLAMYQLLGDPALRIR